MADRPDSYFTMFVGDYLRDTMHLTTRQHGAYQLLLMHYYGTGKPLPANDEVLRTIAREQASEWKTDRPIVLAFFNQQQDGWHQTRADKELVKAATRYNKAVTAARAKHNPSKPQAGSQAPPKHTSEQCLDAANPNPNPNPNPTASQKNETASAVSRAREKPIRALSWPKEGVISQDWLFDGAELRRKHELPELDLTLEAERFTNHFAASGKPKKDWHRTWLNWCISPYVGAKPNGHGRASGQSGQSLATEVFGAVYARGRAQREGSGE